MVQYLRKVGEIGPSTRLRRPQYGSKWIGGTGGCSFDCAQGLGIPLPRPAIVTLLSVLSSIFHCACMYQGVGQTVTMYVPPACNPDRGGDTDCTIGMGWERGGTPSCQCSMGTPLLEPHGTPALRSVLPTAQRSHGYGAFLVPRRLPLIHKLCFLRITDAECHASVAKPKCDPYPPRLQQKPTSLTEKLGSGLQAGPCTSLAALSRPK